jgi:hypothetical protein
MRKRKTRTSIKYKQQKDHMAVSWISAQKLEDELWDAIQTDGTANGDDNAHFEEVDIFLAGEEELDEHELRNSLLQALASIRPQLAELLTERSTDD